MESRRVRGTAERGARSNEDLEGEEQGGDEIQDLSQLLMDTTRLVQTAAESQKTAELAHHYLEGALRLVSEVLDCSRMVSQASCQFGNRLLDQKDQAGYRALLQSHQGLSTSYGTLLKALHNAEDVLSPVKTRDDGSERRRKFPGARRGPPENGDDAARSHGETEKTSHHKQLETVRNEEQMGGAFLTGRRRSPSSSADRLSPLLSDEEVNTVTPVAQSPSSKRSGRFTNKIIHRERTQEGSDSDAEATHSPSP